MLRSLGITGATSMALLVANAVSGILIARLLDADGKGAVTAITTWVQMGAWIFAFGLPAAGTYLLARRPEIARAIVGTTFAAAAFIGVLATGATQILIYFVFAGQPADVRTLAHVFGLAVLIVVIADFMADLINGHHDFTALNALRFARQVLKVVIMLVLWVVMGLEVWLVLVAFVVAEVIAAGAGVVRVLRSIGVGRPSMDILRTNFRYGVRLQGGQLAGLANHRLDLLIMPLFLSTTDIGLYSVAISVAAVLYSVLGTLRLVIFPAATRAATARERIFLIARALRLITFVATVLSVPLFIAAPWLVPSVYGSAFGEAVPALRILLAGYVFQSGSSVVIAGLRAANRPFAASIGELAAIPLTVLGLVFVLEPYGIEGAAVVSSGAYALSFAVGLALLTRAEGVSLGSLLSLGALADDLSTARRRGVMSIVAYRQNRPPPTPGGLKGGVFRSLRSRRSDREHQPDADRSRSPIDGEP